MIYFFFCKEGFDIKYNWEEKELNSKYFALNEAIERQKSEIKNEKNN